jgi:hypothetical protein
MALRGSEDLSLRDVDCTGSFRNHVVSEGRGLGVSRNFLGTKAGARRNAREPAAPQHNEES